MRVAPVTETLTPGWEQIEPLITPATAAVILAHLRGRAAPGTAQITAELSARGIALIEDCAQAWGRTRRRPPRRRMGNGDGILHPRAYKVISTGEGGLLLADDPAFLALIRALAGDTRQRASAAVWRSKHRMTEVSAALARPQLAASTPSPPPCAASSAAPSSCSQRSTASAPCSPPLRTSPPGTAPWSGSG